MAGYDGREPPFLYRADFLNGTHLAEKLERMAFRVPMNRYWVWASQAYQMYASRNTLAGEAFSMLSQSMQEILVYQYPVQAVLLLGEEGAKKLWTNKKSFPAAARAAAMVRHTADTYGARLTIRGVGVEASVVAFNRLVAESASTEAPENVLLLKHGFDWEVEGEPCGEAYGGSGSGDEYEYSVTWYRDPVRWAYASRSGSSSVLFKKTVAGNWTLEGEVTNMCLSGLLAAGLSVEVSAAGLEPVAGKLYQSAY